MRIKITGIVIIILILSTCSKVNMPKDEKGEETVKEEVSRIKKVVKRVIVNVYSDEVPGGSDGHYTFNRGGSIGDILDQILDIDFSAIEELTVFGDLLVSISGIEQLQNLTYIGINGSLVTNIELLVKLTKLRNIFAPHNQIKTVPDFSGLKELVEINLENNPLVDFINLKKLVKCRAIAFSFYPPDNKELDDIAWDLNDYLKKNGVKSYYYPYRTSEPYDPAKQ